MDSTDPSLIARTPERSGKRQDRHDPTVRKDYLSIQHLERYVFATKKLRSGMLVLDVACGTGYGAKMLRDHGCRVVGGDLDKGELAMASRDATDINFVCLDVLNLPFADEKFDAVVSFETIEHVVEGQRFLDEMRRVLKPGGLFICSTPNIAYTAHPWYHVKEYEPREFFSIVLNKFKKTEKYGQYFRRLDRLTDRVTWFGSKSRLRKLLCRGPRIALSAIRAIRRMGRNAAQGSAEKTGQDGPKDRDYYGVHPYRGPSMLRIMVTVSVK